MARQKRSFFERITGIKKVSADEEEMLNFQNDSSSQMSQMSAEDDFFGQTNQAQQQYREYEIPRQDLQENTSDELPPLEPQSQYYQQQVSQEIASVSNVTSKPSPASHQQIEAEGQLTIDVYQTDDDIVIKSTIAGVKPEDLDVNINNDMITIRGERKQDEEIDPENYYYQECYWGPFSRSVILPIEIVAEKAEASMKNGILTLRMPKADTTRTRKIQVRGF